MTFQQELFYHLFGQTATPANVAANIIYFLVGVAFVAGINSTKGVITNPATPSRFSLGYFLCDNKGRILRTLALGMIITFGGANLFTLFAVQVPEALGRFVPLVAGLLSDYISLQIGKFIRARNTE